MPLSKPLRGIQLNKSHPLVRGLIACWLMNEGRGSKVFDSSGYRNTGTLSGDTIWTPGQYGAALQFDGDGDYIDAGNAASLDLTGNLSIVVRFLATSWTNNNYPGLISKRDTNASSNWQLFYYKTYADIEFWYGNSGTNKLFDALNLNPSLNIWHQIVVTRTGNNWSLYYDGILIGTETKTGAMPTGDTVRIGVLGNDAKTYGFQGKFGNVLLFARALSAAEIALLYRKPFAMFERALDGELLYTLSIVWLAGSAGAQSATSAALRGLRCIAGSAAAQSQGSALCKITRKVIATAADTAYLFGILTLSARLPWFAGSLETERPWLREVLFNCVSANAFKLGTALTGGWFWVRVSGCSALYRGAGMEQIDLTNILAIAAQDAREIRPPSYLLHNSNSTYFYVVRRFNNCGYREYTLRAAVKVSMDAGGAIAKPQPNNVFCSKTEQADGDKIRLVWFYCPLEQKSKPARFKIYWDGQTGQIDYDNPVATVNYQGRKYYNYETIALEAGGNLFAIRAEDASGVENNSLSRSRIDLHTTTPNPVTILSVEAI
jgi:hypothetical protein